MDTNCYVSLNSTLVMAPVDEDGRFHLYDTTMIECLLPSWMR